MPLMSCPSCSRNLIRALIEATTGGPFPIRPLPAQRNLSHPRLRRDATRLFSTAPQRRVQFAIPRDAEEHDELANSIKLTAQAAARAVPAQREDVGTKEWLARRFPYNWLLTEDTPKKIKALMQVEYPLLSLHARKRLRKWAEEARAKTADNVSFPRTGNVPREGDEIEGPLLKILPEKARSPKKEIVKSKKEAKLPKMPIASPKIKKPRWRTRGTDESVPMAPEEKRDVESVRSSPPSRDDATKANSPKKTKEAEKSHPSSPRKEHTTKSTSPKKTEPEMEKEEEKSRNADREPWQIQKEALKSKFGEQGWNPKRRLSPDALEGIRTLHRSDPTVYTTPVLAQEFKVSAEAIRRILKSKWRPSEEEDEDRARRWQKRGEIIWDNMAQMGVRPPKKWRDMGAGRVEGGRSVIAPYKKGGSRVGKEDLPWGRFREEMVFKPKMPIDEDEEEYGGRIL